MSSINKCLFIAILYEKWYIVKSYMYFYYYFM